VGQYRRGERGERNPGAAGSQAVPIATPGTARSGGRGRIVGTAVRNARRTGVIPRKGARDARSERRFDPDEHDREGGKEENT